MLSPRACPFSLTTDVSQFQTEAQQKKILNGRKAQKKGIALQLSKLEDKIQLKDKSKEEEKDWKEAAKVASCGLALATKSNATKQKAKENCHGASQTGGSDTEGEEDCEPRGAQAAKEMIKDKEETCDASEMIAEESNSDEKEDRAVEQMAAQEMKRIARDALGAEKDGQKEVNGVACRITEIFLGECAKEHQRLESMDEETDEDAREVKLRADRKIEQAQMLKEEIESKEQRWLVKANEPEESMRECKKELKVLSEDDRRMAESTKQAKELAKEKKILEERSSIIEKESQQAKSKSFAFRESARKHEGCKKREREKSQRRRRHRK